MARGTSPDGTHWWLHAKPLTTAIGQVLARSRRIGPAEAMVVVVVDVTKTQHTTNF
jgi:hypothetical protein